MDARDREDPSCPITWTSVAGVSSWTAVVRPDITAWLARKVAVTDHLEAVGAPVVANSRELPPGPHERDGLAMAFTEWAPPDPDRTPEVADCVAMLPDLHAALASYPGELPLLAAVHNDIPYGLAALERHPDVLSPQERDRLLAAHERLTPFPAAPGGTTVLHGCRSRQARQLSTLPAVGSKGRA